MRNSQQQIPTITLLTESHPLISSAINHSLSIYSTSKSYSRHFRCWAEFVERTIGSPVASTVGRVSRGIGVDNGLRHWVLKGGHISYVDDGLGDDSHGNNPRKRPMEEFETISTTFASPQKTRPPGIIMAIMSNDQLRSLLHYYLSWLQWANGQLHQAILSLKATLQEFSYGDAERQANATTLIIWIFHCIEGLGNRMLSVMKAVVDVISEYTLPEKVCGLIQAYFPERFISGDGALILVREGLEALSRVTGVVNGVLDRAQGGLETGRLDHN